MTTKQNKKKSKFMLVVQLREIKPNGSWIPSTVLDLNVTSDKDQKKAIKEIQSLLGTAATDTGGKHV